MKRFVAVLALVALLPLARDARAEGSRGSFELWVHQSLATQSLQGWNDQYDQINEGLRFFGIPDRVNSFGNAIPFGAEVNYRLRPGMIVGIGFESQRALADNFFTDNVGFVIDDVPTTVDTRDELSLNTTTAIFGLDIGRTGLTLWGELGYGFAEAESFVQITPIATPSSPLVVSDARWEGNAMVGAIALGFRRELGGRSMISAKVGYLMADMGELEGPAGPPTNFLGEPIGTDFSGVHVTAGIGIILNRVR